jgi:hypothetical protein
VPIYKLRRTPELVQKDTMLEYLNFFADAGKRQFSYKCFEIAKKNTQVRQSQLQSQITEVRHVSILSFFAMLCSTDGYKDMISALSTPTPRFLI